MSDNAQQSEALFSLERVYVKDSSYEAPGVPAAFGLTQAPSLNIRLNIQHDAVPEAEGFYEVVLTAEAKAEHEGKPLFLAEVHQAGLFHIRGVPPEAMPQLLEIASPNILLPFLREAVNDLVVKGGFPQLLITPVNFEALYQQKEAALRAPPEGQPN